MRCSIGMRSTRDATALVERARRWEAAGIGGVWTADHLGAPDPFVPLAAVAGATESLRVGTLVVNQDFWHPALLARAAGTLAAVVPGRSVLGIGTGYARNEYEAMGLPFGSRGERVDRTVALLDAARRLLAGETVSVDTLWFSLTECHLGSAVPAQPPALLVGGNGDRILTIAAAEADIVGFVGFTSADPGQEPALTHFSWDGLAERMALVRAARGGRPFEAQLLVQRVEVTDDPESVVGPLAAEVGLPLEVALDNPFLLVGPVAEVRERLARLEELGISDVTVFEDSADALLAALGPAGGA